MTLPKLPPMARSLSEGERLFFLDCVTRIASGKMSMQDLHGATTGGGGSPILTAVNLDWNVVLRQGNGWYDRLVAAAELPTRSERSSAMAKIDAELTKLSPTTNPRQIVGAFFSSKGRGQVISDRMMLLLLPAISACTAAEDRATAVLELTRTAAALAKFRAQHQEYPETLAQLVADAVACTAHRHLFRESVFVSEKRRGLPALQRLRKWSRRWGDGPVGEHRRWRMGRLGRGPRQTPGVGLGHSRTMSAAPDSLARRRRVTASRMFRLRRLQRACRLANNAGMQPELNSR